MLEERRDELGGEGGRFEGKERGGGNCREQSVEGNVLRCDDSLSRAHA